MTDWQTDIVTYRAAIAAKKRSSMSKHKDVSSLFESIKSRSSYRQTEITTYRAAIRAKVA